MRPRGAHFLLLVLAGLMAAASLAGGPGGSARAASESALARQAAAQAQRLAAVSGDLAAAQRHLDALLSNLNTQRARLAQTEATLTHERARLVRLRLRLDLATRYLASVLVADYETDKPDLVNVVLEARGFADLLERIDNAKAIARRNASAVHDIRAARNEVTRELVRLASLRKTQQREVTAVAAREEAAATIRERIAARRLRLATVHAHTVGQLNALRAARAAAAARLRAAQRSAATALAPPASDVVSGPGFTFPLPKSAASPRGTWSPDQGVDISAPGHTPLLAVRSGTIVGHGINGFGDWAPILHLDDGRYVYYGHAGPGNMVAVGTHVGAGQVIGEVGAGIVGISTGPHLEIGFATDSSGNPIGPQTSGTMMALLQSAYGS
jgi:murein DD-endopeptidase MepM/ murein hydrolase activator NlpD